MPKKSPTERLNSDTLLAAIDRVTSGEPKGKHIRVRTGHGRDVRNRIMRMRRLSSVDLRGATVAFVADPALGRDEWIAEIAE